MCLTTEISVLPPVLCPRDLFCSPPTLRRQPTPAHPYRVWPVYIYILDTDSSSDSASHTHSARRPSATALLTRSRGGGLTQPPSHTPTLRHTLSPTGLMPLSGLCALEGCGLACCGRHGVPRCAPGAGEKPVAFCRTLVLFAQKENSRNCVWVAGSLSPCECVC